MVANVGECKNQCFKDCKHDDPFCTGTDNSNAVYVIGNGCYVDLQFSGFQYKRLDKSIQMKDMWETIASYSYILLFFFVLINAKAVYHLKKV